MASSHRPPRASLPVWLFAAVAWGLGGGAGAQTPASGGPPADKTPSAKQAKQSKPRLDHSGKKHKGKASYYSRKFAGKKMADGTPMNPESNSAASKTLPLGTKAKVTNLRNGKSAVVEIRDRGPYVAGRSIDLSPKTAKDLGMGKQGVAPVEIAPLEVPQPDGSVKPAPVQPG